MRILVLSDTHGDFNRMMKAVTEQPTAEVIIHCGDGEEQVEYLKQNVKENDIVLTLGAGTVTKIGPMLKDAD